MEQIEVKLTRHAIRYLREMCKSERRYLNNLMAETFGPTLAAEAAFNSLNEIECALPNE